MLSRNGGGSLYLAGIFTPESGLINPWICRGLLQRSGDRRHSIARPPHSGTASQSDHVRSLDLYEIHTGDAGEVSVSSVNVISSVPALGQSTPPDSLVNVEVAFGRMVAIASPLVSVV